MGEGVTQVARHTLPPLAPEPPARLRLLLQPWAAFRSSGILSYWKLRGRAEPRLNIGLLIGRASRRYEGCPTRRRKQHFGQRD
jgi:hypothetical protein